MSTVAPQSQILILQGKRKNKIAQRSHLKLQEVEELHHGNAGIPCCLQNSMDGGGLGRREGAGQKPNRRQGLITSQTLKTSFIPRNTTASDQQHFLCLSVTSCSGPAPLLHQMRLNKECLRRTMTGQVDVESKTLTVVHPSIHPINSRTCYARTNCPWHFVLKLFISFQFMYFLLLLKVCSKNSCG